MRYSDNVTTYVTAAVELQRLASDPMLTEGVIGVEGAKISGEIPVAALGAYDDVSETITDTLPQKMAAQQEIMDGLHPSLVEMFALFPELIGVSVPIGAVTYRLSDESGTLQVTIVE